MNSRRINVRFLLVFPYIIRVFKSFSSLFCLCSKLTSSMMLKSWGYIQEEWYEVRDCQTIKIIIKILPFSHSSASLFATCLETTERGKKGKTEKVFPSKTPSSFSSSFAIIFIKNRGHFSIISFKIEKFKTIRLYFCMNWRCFGCSELHCECWKVEIIVNRQIQNCQSIFFVFYSVASGLYSTDQYIRRGDIGVI